VTHLFELIAVAVLILVNGFFVAAEYGLVTVRRTRMLELERAGDRRARLVHQITESPPRFIAAMQLGVTLTSLAIGAVGERVLSEIFGTVLATVLAVILAYLVLTFLHVVIGELVPKAIALGYSERVALAVAAPVRLFFIVAAPLIWVLRRSTVLVLQAFGLAEPGAEGSTYSEAELKMLVSESTERGEIESDEREMLYKVFDFAEKEVSDVMVPRPQVVALSIDLPPEEAFQAVLDSPYTRYPVYRGSLDEIVGVLHVRDLIVAMHERGIASVHVEELIRPAYMVPETKDLGALLTEFRRQNQHMAIVLDEYGAMEGIVTLEDVLEEIVGEIEDEFDLPDESIEQIDDHTIRIDGTFPIDDFNEQFHTDLPQEDYHTIAGFVFGQLGRGAELDDEIVHGRVRFRVDEVDGSRILKLTVTFEPDEGSEEPAAAEG
jgi:putative hemolysin